MHFFPTQTHMVSHMQLATTKRLSRREYADDAIDQVYGCVALFVLWRERIGQISKSVRTLGLTRFAPFFRLDDSVPSIINKLF